MPASAVRRVGLERMPCSSCSSRKDAVRTMTHARVGFQLRGRADIKDFHWSGTLKTQSMVRRWEGWDYGKSLHL
jgi:hypothetical protein